MIHRAQGYSKNVVVGDPVRVFQAEVIVDTIRKENLLERVRQAEAVLVPELQRLSQRYPQLVANVRGRGTFLAFDCGHGQREPLLAALRRHGIHMGPCGNEAIRIRPALIFGPEHARLFIGILEETLAGLHKQRK